MAINSLSELRGKTHTADINSLHNPITMAGFCNKKKINLLDRSFPHFHTVASDNIYVTSSRGNIHPDEAVCAGKYGTLFFVSLYAPL